jgi:hypothetical protein
MKSHVAFGTLFMLLFGTFAHGQEYRGRMLGRVGDPSGAVVPQARITITNTSTNVATDSQTNAEGNFLVILDPGSYNVTVEAAGFKKKVIAGIVVRAGDQLSLEFPLEVGSSTDSVTVSGESPQLETATASISQVVDRRFLDQLYISNRNPLNLVSLTAGVYTGTYGPSAVDTQQNQFSVNGGGARTGGNEVVVDGASIVLPRQRGSMAGSPSGDTVEELRVQTTMFDAAYGHTSGGVISYATRGGTNQVHGSFEGFYRNKVFNANAWSSNKNGLPRQDVNRKFFSGTVGGPVYLPRVYDGRNRTFFFVSVQKEKNMSPQSYLGRTMTEQEKAGDFSGTLNGQGTALQIYDPYSTIVTGSTATRSLFPGARIPASRFNPVGAAIAKQYPAPTLQVTPRIGVNNWAGGAAVAQPATNLSVRLDENLSSRHRMFGRLGYMLYNAEPPDGLPSGFALYEGEWRDFWTASLNNDFTLTPTFLATVRYSFGREATRATASSLNRDPKELNLPDVILRNALAQVWPQISLGEGLLGIGGRIKFRANDTHAIVPSFSKLAGNHTIRFGGDARLINWNSIEPGYAMTGSFSFNNAFTRSDPFTATTGNTTGTSMASLLLGVPGSGSFGATSPYSLRQYYYAAFVQDDWKVTPRLTLNLGLRWELETPWQERYDRLSYGFDYNAASPVRVPGVNVRGGLLFAGVQGASRWQGNLDKNNIGPRIGFAYQIGRETVIRGGYALFYAPESALLDTQTAIPVTFDQTATYVASADSGATPFTNLSNPFPAGIPPVQGSAPGLAARLGDSLTFIDQGRVSPYTQQLQFGVQRSLPGKIRLEANFIRMLSLKFPDNFNLNEKPDQYLALGAAENNRVSNPFYNVYPVSSSVGSSSTIAQRQFWLAYPQYTSLTVAGAPTHNSAYNAVQLNLEKRLSNGLSLLANYSISKLTENNITSLVNTRHYRAISSLDRSRSANVAWVYDLPFGKGRKFGTGMRGVGGFLASNWSMSGRYYHASGIPLAISDTNGRPLRLRNAAIGGRVRDRLGDRVDPVTRQVLNPYFDVTAFQSLPNQYTVSPEPPYFGELRGPGTTSLDVSLIKRFRIRERLNADMRADVSNATNTPLLGNPGTSFANKGTFGVITTDSNWAARNMQLAFRVVF